MNVRTVLDMIDKTLKDTPERQGISHLLVGGIVGARPRAKTRQIR